MPALPPSESLVLVALTSAWPSESSLSVLTSRSLLGPSQTPSLSLFLILRKQRNLTSSSPQSLPAQPKGPSLESPQGEDHFAPSVKPASPPNPQAAEASCRFLFCVVFAFCFICFYFFPSRHTSIVERHATCKFPVPLTEKQNAYHASQLCLPLEFGSRCIIKCHLCSIVHEFTSMPLFKKYPPLL